MDKISQKKTHQIGSQWLSLQEIEHIVEKKMGIELSEEAIEKITACRDYLDRKIAEDDDALFYGINTGFGYLQNVRIEKDQISELQYNLLKSHACGVGEKVPKAIVKLMLLTKIQSLAYGNSGVQLITVQRLVDFYNHDVLPVVYRQGSLGASGDLAPLSHLSLPLIGLGEVYFEGKIVEAGEVLKNFSWTPITLKSKEGLSLINGTQFMLAYGIHCLMSSKRLLEWADIIAAICIDGFNCTMQPFNPNIHAIRPHPGQVETAAKMRRLLKGSEIAESKSKAVQDPYSFRCIPQVHGASRDTFNYVLGVFEREINAVTDNPNIFPEEDQIVSGGNFHGQPLALGFDFLAIAMAEIGNIAERRTYQLLSGQRGLPLFLIKNPGLHSGMMIPQYTAASVVSENKQLCTPSSVDSITSSNGQEDHVSMGANGATKCFRVIENVEKVLAIELFSATQALEFRRPSKSSDFIEGIVSSYRKEVPFNDVDRVLSTDIAKSIAFIKNKPALLQSSY
ncbi:histidine ammonia-lyase [Litoribacter ruber]|uniref:histidine ammonia-lyase n=1 Tax=Litoribacter ruber TaxID=702568 RepID=UPI001BD9BBF0|nr:histidine ammonia-lyase [Litoribacter ruber]MBT0812462.1 histidine ammonia-lyase [Litoribacter ruber]